jgi:hypothetical protein
MAMNGFKKSRIYLLNRSVFMSRDIAIHFEAEGEHSKQGAHEPTVCRNSRLPLNAEGVAIFNK